LEHARLRSSRPVQAGGRIFTPEQFQEIAGGKEKLTLPRDNPVKDFLISADEKFAAFDVEDPDFYGLLAIVWDDFIFEPITALLHPNSGLLTESSFARDVDGEPLKFPHVDAVLLVSHLQWLKRALGEGPPKVPFAMTGHAFRWNFDAGRPVAVVGNPHARGLPEWVAELLDVRPLEEIPGAEYQPSDFVRWIDMEHPES
jgi:hypothetical protein